ncbi:MAG: type I DNA topoisomerase [Pseudomonadota bacterium]|nr:type I DNA topoisomerase [Pseudomonadota bacterium]
MSNVVIVESPAKAKTINKYLGSDYKVLASYGHVRDLPSKDGSVRPDENFDMDWEVDDRSKKHIKEIKTALKGASHLYLATDPDREGEAISWHVREILAKENKLDGVTVERVVFNEITKSAILEAFKNPRKLDDELINAYLARRALDYLVGFTLSPVLWRKLPGSRSAGRVQSVALRLVCERETEIENFKPKEYWSIHSNFKTSSGEIFSAILTYLDGSKVGKMDISTEDQANIAVTNALAQSYSVKSVQKRKVQRHPAAPFTTSTLQQESSRKLRFTTKRTMQVAQKLYEGITLDGETVGLISYMRTDGVFISKEAIDTTRELIGQSFGVEYVPNEVRTYKSKAKNAQEAHEAIRPTDVLRRPEDIAHYLDKDQNQLYQLIWNRTIASQMESVVLDQVSADIISENMEITFRATGSTLLFDGFYKLYKEDKDDKNKEDGETEKILPNLEQDQSLQRNSITPEQHFTQPPPRFSEASLVKKLEELGIGRPSTYASIISVLQDRSYVTLEKRRFEPVDRGRLVTAFLDSYFHRYVEYEFTADLEQKLDDISGGRIEWKKVLQDFWESFSSAIGETKDLRVSEVLDKLDELLGPHFFRLGEDGSDPRKCPTCNDGRLNLKLGKFGAFIGCNNYPECRFTRPLEVTNGISDEDEALTSNGPKDLGPDPTTGELITLKKGPYGYYVQRGVEVLEGKKKIKPKRASIPKTMHPTNIDLGAALGLLGLPRNVGIDVETGEMITAGLGRFGPFIKVGGTYLSLKADDDVLSIGLNRAQHLLADVPRKAPPRDLGKHPDDKKPVVQKVGRWGAYVQHGKQMATLPKNTDPSTITLELAIQILADKANKSNQRSNKKTSNKRKTTKQKKNTKDTAVSTE